MRPPSSSSLGLDSETAMPADKSPIRPAWVRVVAGGEDYRPSASVPGKLGRAWRRLERSDLTKRVADLLLGWSISILVGPLMALIALMVKLDSPGPIFYRQLRHGRNGQVFSVIKFRTMFAERCDGPGGRIVQACADDARVTRLGRVLRRLSLDELPQLLNVLGGSMSLVGPRPHPISFLDIYGADIPDYRSRLAVKPGITGWAQIHGLRGQTRTVEDMRRRVEHDIYYVEHRSLSFDLKILFRTLGALDSPHAY